MKLTSNFGYICTKKYLSIINRNVFQFFSPLCRAPGVSHRHQMSQLVMAGKILSQRKTLLTYCFTSYYKRAQGIFASTSIRNYSVFSNFPEIVDERSSKRIFLWEKETLHFLPHCNSCLGSHLCPAAEHFFVKSELGKKNQSYPILTIVLLSIIKKLLFWDKHIFSSH